MSTATNLFDQVAAALAGRYRLERELGRGGMATVYLAQDLRHDRPVALKLLRPELSAALGPERFLREIHLAASLTHPHILPLHDSGTAAGLLYYVMPYVAGESLRDRLRREKQLPLKEALGIATQVLDALGHAHQQGVVHRDIKPENLLLAGDHCLVADFGIARALDAAGSEKLTETGLALGTPAYMSPEQGAGDATLDGRSDLYSLGCVLYEMLAGQPPFTGPTAQAILARHAVDPVPSLRTVRRALPAGVEEAVGTALAKVPADRFATAAEFSQALTAPGPAARRLPLLTPWFLRWAVPSGVVVLLAGAAGAWLALHPRGPNIVPSAARIAVLPFAPSVADTGLTRLGRDLALTVSADLDDVGEVRTVDPNTILAQSANLPAGFSLPDGAALGRRFGAGSVVHGTIVRVGPQQVRVDFGLFTSDSLTPLARASVTASPDSLAVMSDAITHALLRQVWLRGAPPTPSLDAALKTRSAPALRAFLEGERAMLQSHWDAAAKAYQRTIEADSTFWLAYARAAYARQWAGQQPDSALQAVSQRHLSELPESDRLILESWRLGWGDSVSAGLALAQRITDRFPDNWFGWMSRADMLVHLGPHVGLTRHEAIAALERTVELAPDFVPGWEHLAWMYLQQHDTSGSARALGALVRLDAGKALGEGCFGCDYLQQIRLLRALDQPGSPAYRTLVDSVTQDVTHHWWAMPVLPLWYGSQQALIDVDRRALRARRSPEWELGREITLAWAARGAWDSAAAAMEHYVLSNADTTAMRNYPLAVAGVIVGALNSEVALRWGQAAHRAKGLSAESRAQVAWLDGVVAAQRGERTSLAAARAALQQAGASAKLLQESLAAFDLGLHGEHRRAGQALASLEWKLGERAFFASSTESLVMAFDRLTASRWLLEAGDTIQAARLLTWHEAYDASSIAAVLAPLIYLERARIEEARGAPRLAREYYYQFLRRYDMPTPAQRHLVEEARAALARIELEP